MALGLEPAPGPGLEHALEELRATFPDLSVPPPQNLHLTLAFLGEVDADGVRVSAEAVSEAASRAAAFPVRWGAAGAFPSRSRPRVVWLGLADEAATRRVQADLARGLASRGMPLEDRPYRPHLTLGRVRGQLSRARAEDLAGWIGEIAPPPATVARSLVLYRSTPGGASQVYAELSAATLGAR